MDGLEVIVKELRGSSEEPDDDDGSEWSGTGEMRRANSGLRTRAGGMSKIYKKKMRESGCRRGGWSGRKAETRFSVVGGRGGRKIAYIFYIGEAVTGNQILGLPDPQLCITSKTEGGDSGGDEKK